MKLEVGMYVRTKDGRISKMTRKKIDIELKLTFYCFEENIIHRNYEECELNEIVLKASYNIIDLIKSKDIILGRDGKIYQCWKIYKDYVFTYSKNKQGLTITLVDYQIDKVLTKEQFEQMAYKVGE